MQWFNTVRNVWKQSDNYRTGTIKWLLTKGLHIDLTVQGIAHVILLTDIGLGYF